MRTTVVVVTWRGRDHLPACLDALAAQDRPHRTVVVDNASEDGSDDLAAMHPSRPKLVRLTKNLGYAGGLHAALSQVDTEFVAWLNDDAAPAPDWLARLEDALDADPRAAAAGARLIAPDGRTQSIGVRLTPQGYGADATSGTVFGFCGGAALLRTRVLREVGGVPAEFFCYYEDTDTSWRLRLAGWNVLAVPGAVVTHQHGASTRPGSRAFHRWNERNRLIMLFRCAPMTIALRELARFAALTVLLPLRRGVPDEANFSLSLRLRVLAEVTARLPAALLARLRPRPVLRRRAVWRTATTAPVPGSPDPATR